MESQANRYRPRFERASSPPAMRFQVRDGEILRAIQAYGGVLAKRQLKTMFWPAASRRAMEMRLSPLYHQAYLDWPTLEQWRTQPIPEAVCWLGWRGALWLAHEQGVDVLPPKTVSEAQLRVLERELGHQGLRWLREPRWSQLTHDLAVLDFRLAVEQAARATATVTLDGWVLESTFRAEPDVVEFNWKNRDGRLSRRRRGVVPDGYFVMLDRARQQRGLPGRARFLVELDRATHDLPSFGVEKLFPGIAYLRSAAYKARFGDNAGRWLVVTTGEQRMKHLLCLTAQVLGHDAEIFLFATFDRVTNNNVLTSAIWWHAGTEKPISLAEPQ